MSNPASTAITSGTRPRPTPVLYCESNADGTVGGSHYCLLYLVENLDKTQYAPVVTFFEEHSLVDRFRAAAETLVRRPYPAVEWGVGMRGWTAIPVGALRRAANAVQIARRILGHVEFLRARRIGLVHLNNSITRHHEWMVAAALAGIPCVSHERGLPEYGPIDRWLGKRLALIIPMSKWIKDHMVERRVSPSNIRVMYDGLDPSTLQVRRTAQAMRDEWRIRPDQSVIGIVGNIREWKGQETVVRALVEIVKARPDVVCLFVGAASADDKPFKDRLDRIIADAGIAEHVRFTGYQRDVPDFINMMQFVIHASVLPEPFGMVVLEAMAQRKAVVGSRAGGVIEMVVEGETGYTFPPGDARMLASQALDLLENPTRAAEMGARGYARLVSDFTLQHYMDEIHETYRTLIDGRPVASKVTGLASETVR